VLTGDYNVCSGINTSGTGDSSLNLGVRIKIDDTFLP